MANVNLSSSNRNTIKRERPAETKFTAVRQTCAAYKIRRNSIYPHKIFARYFCLSHPNCLLIRPRRQARRRHRHRHRHRHLILFLPRPVWCTCPRRICRELAASQQQQQHHGPRRRSRRRGARATGRDHRRRPPRRGGGGWCGGGAARGGPARGGRARARRGRGCGGGVGGALQGRAPPGRAVRRAPDALLRMLRRVPLRHAAGLDPRPVSLPPPLFRSSNPLIEMRSLARRGRSCSTNLLWFFGGGKNVAGRRRY